jgi:hypothetical protein
MLSPVGGPCLVISLSCISLSSIIVTFAVRVPLLLVTLVICDCPAALALDLLEQVSESIRNRKILLLLALHEVDVLEAMAL